MGAKEGHKGKHPREGESIVPGEGGGPGTPGGGGLSFRYVVGRAVACCPPTRT